jgi:cytochrome b6-f complex iron-sulfur subunit/menaquinol-cytochrome c reductase iron-sulfur subunit
MEQTKKETSEDAEDKRRSFMVKLTGGLVAVLALFPFAAGLPVLLSPLRRNEVKSSWIPVISLRKLPEDGLPWRVPVIAARKDAWTTYPKSKVGYVYCRKSGEVEVKALSANCPHIGCMVDFDKKKGSFLCPCHKARFSKEGRRLDEKNPSPRDMDPLPTKVEDGMVLVRYQKFRPGRTEREPVG